MSKTYNTKTKYSDIKDITLEDFLGVETPQILPAHDLWKDQSTIVIGSSTIYHDIIGLKMICVVHEKEGADIFQNEFWHGKVYFDAEKDFYKALGGGRLRVGGWEQLIRPSFWRYLVRNKRSGVKGNFEGDGSILGGLLVVSAGDNGIAYEHIEKVWGDIAHADKVLEACSQLTGVALSKGTLAKAQEEHDTLHQKMQASSTKRQAGANTSCSTGTS
ncbi:hypothetical protein BGZ80_010520 [Entomortierella chlamydospora]|uniref:Peroxiredoxin-like 2A n=1 Tax=Entomortierella chlamydospora TaxID=101097 RepID=A0A9P6MV88_9FUNG|nr:hypothetical protein BGZ80_010520 [Entomortierella chlamydospora]